MKTAHFELKIDNELSLIIPDVSYAAELFSLINEDRNHLRAWLPWVDATHSAEDTRQNLIERIEKFNNKEQASFYGMVDGEFAASVGFVHLNPEEGEIGYWLLSRYMGRGLMTSFVKACIEFGFETLGLQRIIIKCAEGNTKSAAIPIRLGFVESQETGEEVLRNGEVHRTRIFTLEKGNWSQ